MSVYALSAAAGKSPKAFCILHSRLKRFTLGIVSPVARMAAR
jgi:hypothetical protein